MEKILIGKVTGPIGLGGEIKVYNYSDSDEIYETINEIYVGDCLRSIQRVRKKKNLIILKLEGIDDRDTAEKLRDQTVYVTEDDLPELSPGEYYIRDLIGMKVIRDDAKLGTICDVIKNSAQDILEVRLNSGRTAMIPLVDEFVKEIDAENGTITVELIEGLLDI